MVSAFLGLLPLQIILIKVSPMMIYVRQKVGMVDDFVDPHQVGVRVCAFK